MLVGGPLSDWSLLLTFLAGYLGLLVTVSSSSVDVTVRCADPHRAPLARYLSVASPVLVPARPLSLLTTKAAPRHGV